jgi:hypothetical protein
VRDVGARPANDPLPGQTFAENVKSVNWLGNDQEIEF